MSMQINYKCTLFLNHLETLSIEFHPMVWFDRRHQSPSYGHCLTENESKGHDCMRHNQGTIKISTISF